MCDLLILMFGGRKTREAYRGYTAALHELAAEMHETNLELRRKVYATPTVD